MRLLKSGLLLSFFLCGFCLSGMEGGQEKKRLREDATKVSGQKSTKRARTKAFRRDLYLAFIHQEWDRVQSILNDGAHLNFYYGDYPFIYALLRDFIVGTNPLPFIFALEEGANLNVRSKSGDTIFAFLIQRLAEVYFGRVPARVIGTHVDIMQSVASQGLETFPDRVDTSLWRSIQSIIQDFEKAQNENENDSRSCVVFLESFMRLMMSRFIEAGALPVINSLGLSRLETGYGPPLISLLLRIFLAEGGRLESELFNYQRIFNEISSQDEIIKHILMDELEKVESFIETHKDTILDSEQKIRLIEAFLLAIGQERISIARKLHEAYTFDQSIIQHAFVITAGTGNTELFVWLADNLDATHEHFAQTINNAVARSVGQNHSTLLSLLLERYDFDALITPATLERFLRVTSQNGNIVLFDLLRKRAARLLTNQVAVLNDILVQVAMRGDAAFVQAILDYDRACLFNLGIDLNPAGIQITNSLRTMRLTRELRSIYNHIRRMLQEHILIRRMQRTMLSSLQQDPQNELPILPVELQMHITNLVREIPPVNRQARANRAAFQAYKNLLSVQAEPISL